MAKKTGRELYDLWRAGAPGKVAPDRWEASSDEFRHRWNYIAARQGGSVDVTDRVNELDPGSHNLGPDETRTDFKGFGESISDFGEYEGIKRIDPKKWEIPRFEVTAEEKGKRPLSDEQIADRAGETLHQMLVELLGEPEMREALLDHIFGEPNPPSEPENLETQKLQAESGLDWLIHTQ